MMILLDFFFTTYIIILKAKRSITASDINTFSTIVRGERE